MIPVAECGAPGGALDCAKLVAGAAVNKTVDSGASSLGESMMAGWDLLMKEFLTSWLDVGLLVSLDGNSVRWLTDQLEVISVFFAVIGIMIAGIWTMLHFRGDKAVGVAKALFTVMLVTTLGTAVVQLVIRAGDLFSDWVLANAGITSGGLGNLAAAGGAAVAISPGFAILAGIFGIIATGIQWLIMLIRATLLPLLVAVWPLTAAASMIAGSEQAFSKLTKWMIAFILYKPVAAIIYAFAWRLKSGEEGLGGVLNGLLLLVLAIVALPALMRLITPGTSALGGAAGGSMALAGGAAVGAAAVSAGAMIITGGGSAAATAGSAGPQMMSKGSAAASPSAGPGAGPGGGSGSGPSPAGGTPTTPGDSSGSGSALAAPAGGAGISGDTGSASGTTGGPAGGSGAGSAVSDSGGAGSTGIDSAAGGAGASAGGGGKAQGDAGAAAPGLSPTADGAPSSGGTAGDSGGARNAEVASGTAAAGDGSTSSALGGTSAAGTNADDTGGGSAGTSTTGTAAGAPGVAPPPASETSGAGPRLASGKGAAAARSATESLGGSVADGARDVNGEDVVGG